MTLEEILKSLKKGEIRQYETVDEYNRYRIIEVRRNEDGLYGITLEQKYALGFYDSIEEIFNELKNYYWTQWCELNYEVYKDHQELKEENTQLKEALERACSYICCDYCPLYFDELESCSKAFSERFCAAELSDYFLNEVK